MLNTDGGSKYRIYKVNRPTLEFNRPILFNRPIIAIIGTRLSEETPVGGGGQH